MCTSGGPFLYLYLFYCQMEHLFMTLFSDGLTNSIAELCHCCTRSLREQIASQFYAYAPFGLYILSFTWWSQTKKNFTIQLISCEWLCGMRNIRHYYVIDHLFPYYVFLTFFSCYLLNLFFLLFCYFDIIILKL